MMTMAAAFAGRGIAASALIAGSPVERRLGRRAETIWRRATAEEWMEIATIQLMAPPFAANCALFSVRDGHDPHLGFVGEMLGGTFAMRLGPVPAIHRVRAPAASRLAALAADAVATRVPVRLEDPFWSEADNFLLRAIALPMQVTPKGATVIVIASWRQLLDSEAADCIEAELARTVH